MGVTLPDFTSIKVPTPDPTLPGERGISIITPRPAETGIDAIEQGIQNVGQGVAKLGADLQTAQTAAQQKATELQRANANSQWLVNKTNLDAAQKNETDTDKLKVFGQQYQSALNNAAQNITDPQERQKFILNLAPDVAAGQVGADTRKFALEKDNYRAYTLKTLDDLRSSAQAAPDEAARRRIIDSGNDQITKGEEAGYFSAYEAQTHRQDFVTGYAADSTRALPPAQQLMQLSPAPQSYFDKLGQIETGGNPDQVSSTGARGKYQFTASTWARYGQGRDINDPAAQEAAVRLLTADNYQQLRYRLGREPTEGELGLAHNQGAAGALKLLDNQQTRAGDLVGDKAIARQWRQPRRASGRFRKQIGIEVWRCRENPNHPSQPAGDCLLYSEQPEVSALLKCWLGVRRPGRQGRSSHGHREDNRRESSR